MWDRNNGICGGHNSVRGTQAIGQRLPTIARTIYTFKPEWTDSGTGDGERWSDGESERLSLCGLSYTVLHYAVTLFGNTDTLGDLSSDSHGRRWIAVSTVTCWWKGKQIPCSEVSKYQGAETSGPLPPGSYGWTSTHTSSAIPTSSQSSGGTPTPSPSSGGTTTSGGSTQTTTSGTQTGTVNVANQCSSGVVANIGGKTVYAPPYRAVSVTVDLPASYTLTSEGETVGQGTVTRPGEYISPQFCPTLTPSPTPGPTPSPSPSGGSTGTSGGLTTMTTTTTPTTGGSLPIGIILIIVILGVLVLGGTS